MTTTAPTAIVTGASRGLGLALARSLADDGWALVVDGRDAAALRRRRRALGRRRPIAIAGDIADEAHRDDLATAAAVARAGSTSWCSTPARSARRPCRRSAACASATSAPRSRSTSWPSSASSRRSSPTSGPAPPSWRSPPTPRSSPTRAGAPTAPPRPGFEQLAAILGAERPDLRVLRVDPGDMRTQMHQDAFPGEDISDRPEPEESVPGAAGAHRRARSRPAATGSPRSRRPLEVA